MFGLNIRVLRFYMGGVFAIAALICTCLALWLIQHAFGIRQFQAFTHPRVLLLNAIFPVMATIFAFASWKIWREEPSARGWGIAASTLLTLLPLWQIILRSRPIWSCHGINLAIGIVGLIIFLSPNEKRSETNPSEADNDDPNESETEHAPPERH